MPTKPDMIPTVRRAQAQRREGHQMKFVYKNLYPDGTTAVDWDSVKDARRQRSKDALGMLTICGESGVIVDYEEYPPFKPKEPAKEPQEAPAPWITKDENAAPEKPSAPQDDAARLEGLAHWATMGDDDRELLHRVAKRLREAPARPHPRDGGYAESGPDDGTALGLPPGPLAASVHTRLIIMYTTVIAGTRTIHPTVSPSLKEDTRKALVACGYRWAGHDNGGWVKQ